MNPSLGQNTNDPSTWIILIHDNRLLTVDNPVCPRVCHDAACQSKSDCPSVQHKSIWKPCSRGSIVAGFDLHGSLAMAGFVLPQVPFANPNKWKACLWSRHWTLPSLFYIDRHSASLLKPCCENDFIMLVETLNFSWEETSLFGPLKRELNWICCTGLWRCLTWGRQKELSPNLKAQVHVCKGSRKLINSKILTTYSLWLCQSAFRLSREFLWWSALALMLLESLCILFLFYI